MARSPASKKHEVLTVLAAAAAGWAVLVAAGFQLVTPAPAPAPAVAEAPASERVHVRATHRPLSTPVWQGAPRVYAELDRRARALAPEDRARVARAILEEAEEAGVAPLLVLAVIHVESRYDPRAVSPVGAVGLMQLMLPTMRDVLDEVEARADPFDPVANVRAGVRYLGHLVETFSDVQVALVAYNAGPARVRQHLVAGGIPARLLAYPRDVLREAVRLWPRTETPSPVRERPAVRVALGASHRRSPLPEVGPAVACAGWTEAAPTRDACFRIDLALPMTRGRDRTRQVAARTPTTA